MGKKVSALVAFLVATFFNEAFAGEFYKLYPLWLEYAYRLLALVLISAGLFVCFSVFNTLRGGKFGLPWAFLLMALVTIFIRTLLEVLTVFDIAYFQAYVFAGIYILFFLLLLVGFILYKIGLE